MLDKDENRDVSIISLVRGLSAAVFAISIPFLSIYLYEKRGYSMSEIGFISGLSTFLGAFVRILSGGIADIISPTKVLFYGILIRGLALFLTSLLIISNADIYFFAFTIFLNSAAFSLIINGSNSFISYRLKDDIKRIMAISKVRVGINIGFSLGPVLGGFISHYSYSALFLFASLITLSVLPTLKNLHYEHKSGGKSLKGYFSDLAEPFEDRKFILLSSAGFFSAMLFSQFINTLPVFASHYSIDKRLIGYFFTVNGIAVILLQLKITEFAASKLENLKSALVGLFFYSTAFIMFGISQNFFWLLFSVFYMTIGEMLVIPSIMGAAMSFSPENKKGVYLGFFEFFEVIGWATGKYIGGLVFDNFVQKPIIMWSILSGLSILPLFPMLLIHRISETKFRK